MFRSSVIALALVLGAPMLYTAFVEHQMSASTALTRLLIAIPAAALLLGLMRVVTASYQRDRKAQDPKTSPAVRAKSARD